MASSPAEPTGAGAAGLALADADRIVAAALEAARRLGFAAAVAIVDAGGHLLAFRRDDGAGFVTARIARRKAWTAAASGLSSDRWNAIAADPGVAPILHGTGLLAVAGGLPVSAGERIVGAIGVSGGSAQQDHAAAAAALTATGGGPPG